MKNQLKKQKSLWVALTCVLSILLFSLPPLLPPAVTSATADCTPEIVSWLSLTPATAAEQTAGQVQVYVTITNGTLLLSQEAVTVTDIDDDGLLTINDALFAAHEAKYAGGAAAGYAALQTELGLGLSKLWGVEQGSSYGYYVNNTAAMSLKDPVKEGDYINAYIFTDPENLSDTYCYFNENTAAVNKGESLELCLSAAAFDANWNPITVPVADAAITINGAASQFTTDADGKVVITFDKAGETLISATSATQNLVPPVCLITVASSGLSVGWLILIAAAAIAAIGLIIVALRQSKAK